MVNRALMAAVVHRAHRAFRAGCRVTPKKDAVDVHPVPKAIRAESETPVVPDRKARLVILAVMETLATKDKPVQPAQQARKRATEEQAKKDNPAVMPKMAKKAPPDPPVELDQPVPLAHQVVQVPMVIITPAQVPPVQPVQQATQATMEHPVIPAVEDNPEVRAKIVIIVHAPVIVKRRSKLKLKLTTLTSFLLDAIFVFLAEKQCYERF